MDEKLVKNNRMSGVLKRLSLMIAPRMRSSMAFERSSEIAAELDNDSNVSMSSIKLKSKRFADVVNSNSPHLLAFLGDYINLEKLLRQDSQTVNALYEFYDVFVKDDEYQPYMYKTDNTFVPPPHIPKSIRAALHSFFNSPQKPLTLEAHWLLKTAFGGSTLLHYACASDQYNVVQLLCRYGADMDVINRGGKTPEFYTIDTAVQAIFWGADDATDVKNSRSTRQREGTISQSYKPHFGQQQKQQQQQQQQSSQLGSQESTLSARKSLQPSPSLPPPPHMAKRLSQESNNSTTSPLSQKNLIRHSIVESGLQSSLSDVATEPEIEEMEEEEGMEEVGEEKGENASVSTVASSKSGPLKSRQLSRVIQAKKHRESAASTIRIAKAMSSEPPNKLHVASVMEKRPQIVAKIRSRSQYTLMTSPQSSSPIMSQPQPPLAPAVEGVDHTRKLPGRHSVQPTASPPIQHQSPSMHTKMAERKSFGTAFLASPLSTSLSPSPSPQKNRGVNEARSSETMHMASSKMSAATMEVVAAVEFSRRSQPVHLSVASVEAYLNGSKASKEDDWQMAKQTPKRGNRRMSVANQLKADDNRRRNSSIQLFFQEAMSATKLHAEEEEFAEENGKQLAGAIRRRRNSMVFHNEKPSWLQEFYKQHDIKGFDDADLALSPVDIVARRSASSTSKVKKSDLDINMLDDNSLLKKQAMQYYEGMRPLDITSLRESYLTSAGYFNDEMKKESLLELLGEDFDYDALISAQELLDAQSNAPSARDSGTPTKASEISYQNSPVNQSNKASTRVRRKPPKNSEMIWKKAVSYNNHNLNIQSPNNSRVGETDELKRLGQEQGQEMLRKEFNEYATKESWEGLDIWKTDTRLRQSRLNEKRILDSPIDIAIAKTYAKYRYQASGTTSSSRSPQ